MNDTPTPETDAAERCIDEIPQFPFVSSNFARRLERERDNYSEQADGYLVRLGETQERMIDAIRELDEMTLRWERANDALFEERALADRLALALKMTRWDSPATCKAALTAWKEARK